MTKHTKHSSYKCQINSATCRFLLDFFSQNISYQFNLTNNDSNVLIHRKPELRIANEPELILWNKNIDLVEFIEKNYHMDVDIYTHDSKYLYDLHSDDIGLIYYSGANTLYHESFNSPVSKLLKVLSEINLKLEEKKAEFVTEESKQRYSRFALALAFKQEFWFLSQRLNLKMKMDYAEEFTPIIVDSKQKLYMDPELKYMTMDSLDVDKIFKFFFDYIQGNLKEHLESEPLDESFVVDKHWKRRLNQTEASNSLSTLPGKVGKYLLSSLFVTQALTYFRNQENCGRELQKGSRGKRHRDLINPDK